MTASEQWLYILSPDHRGSFKKGLMGNRRGLDRETAAAPYSRREGGILSICRP